MKHDLNTPIWQLTLGQLLEAITEHLNPEQAQPTSPPAEYDKNVVYGIDGIATLLGCSKTMVWKYRKKGWIEPAIRQRGRKIVCNAPLALALFGKRKTL
jgi:hypothetical protein